MFATQTLQHHAIEINKICFALDYGQVLIPGSCKLLILHEQALMKPIGHCVVWVPLCAPLRMGISYSRGAVTQASGSGGVYFNPRCVGMAVTLGQLQPCWLQHGSRQTQGKAALIADQNQKVTRNWFPLSKSSPKNINNYMFSIFWKILFIICYVICNTMH